MEGRRRVKWIGGQQVDGLGVATEAIGLLTGRRGSRGARETDEVLLTATGACGMAGGANVEIPIVHRRSARSAMVDQKAVEADAFGVELRLLGKVGEDVGEGSRVASLSESESTPKAFVWAALAVGLPDRRIGGEDRLRHRAELCHWNRVPL